MTLAILAIVVGFIALTWSADRFISGAEAIARQWNISPMLIGLTLVSIGTSAPEMLVSIMAASQGHAEMAVGNALGSNITNIGLVLGITALISPLVINKTTILREVRWMLLVTLLAGVCMLDGHLNLVDSLLLLGLLILTLYLMCRWQKEHFKKVNIATDIEPNIKKLVAWIYVVGGMIILLGSSQLLVWGAVRIAQLMGVSELVIGLTVIAVGTSLPELAAAIMGTIRKQHDIALGSIAGSNIFNLLLVLAIPGFMSPGRLDPAVMSRDYPVVLGLTMLFSILVMNKKTKRISRFAGMIFLASYVLYVFGLYIQLT